MIIVTSVTTPNNTATPGAGTTSAVSAAVTPTISGTTVLAMPLIPLADGPVRLANPALDGEPTNDPGVHDPPPPAPARAAPAANAAPPAAAAVPATIAACFAPGRAGRVQPPSGPTIPSHLPDNRGGVGEATPCGCTMRRNGCRSRHAARAARLTATMGGTHGTVIGVLLSPRDRRTNVLR